MLYEVITRCHVSPSLDSSPRFVALLVITSYSIHYTKLYDPAARGAGSATLALTPRSSPRTPRIWSGVVLIGHASLRP